MCGPIGGDESSVAVLDAPEVEQKLNADGRYDGEYTHKSGAYSDNTATIIVRGPWEVFTYKDGREPRVSPLFSLTLKFVDQGDWVPVTN